MLSDGESKLPARYRDDRLHVLATGPTGCWVYWDEGEAVVRIASSYLPNGWQSAPRQLRVQDGQGNARLLPCLADYGSMHITELTAGGRYRVEYGLVVGEQFLPLLEKQVRLPGVSTETERLQIRTERISSYSLYRQA